MIGLCRANCYRPSGHNSRYVQFCEPISHGAPAVVIPTALATTTGGGRINRAYPVYHILPMEADWSCSSPAGWRRLLQMQREHSLEDQQLSPVRQHGWR